MTGAGTRQVQGSTDWGYSTDLSYSSFFVSNDHYYVKGMSRELETKYGPWKWASNVVYCNEAESKLTCKVVSPKNSHASANGLVLVDQGKSLLVNDVIYGTTTVYDVNPETKMLTLKKKIVIPLF